MPIETRIHTINMDSEQSDPQRMRAEEISTVFGVEIVRMDCFIQRQKCTEESNLFSLCNDVNRRPQNFRQFGISCKLELSLMTKQH